ncbi:MAG: CRISPR-associated endonuclease Cas3'', partial [Chloroflexi bacterium]
MPKISEEAKQRNKEQALMLIHRHSGLREVEIAEILRLERRTVNNYLKELEYEGKIYKDGHLWHASPAAASWLRRFELAADEAFTLYLAARQFVKQSDKQNRMALSALSRLAEVLKTDLPVGDQIFRAAQELRQRKKAPGYEDIFSTVVRAFLMRHPLQLTYRTAQGYEFNTIFQTYLIEPSAIGRTLYLIGHSSHVNELRSYKIERIVTAVPDRSQTYTIPDDFPGLDILRNAWSIIMGETTQRVELRFSKKAKKRVLETNWHPSQGWEEEADGRLRWWVDVADTTDMKPWIRSWGDDVEVLRPDSLRKELKRTAKQLGEMYQLRPPAERRPYQWLYAKTDRKDRDQIHLLLYHLIDVGSTAHVMWQTVFTDSFRRQIANLLGVTIVEAGRFIAFAAALHDLGKASPAYQNKYAPQWLRDKFKEIGLLIAPAHYNSTTQEIPHATVTAWALPPLLVEYEAYDSKFAKKVSAALGGHHGSWPGSYATDGIDDSPCPLWDEMRRDLYWELRAVFPPPPITTKLSPYDLNRLLTLLSGLISVADWIGSNP